MKKILVFRFGLFALVSAFGLSSAQAAFDPAKLAEIDATINEAISSNKCPGGVFWLEHKGESYHKAYGNRAIEPQKEAMTEDTIFDAASLTKVCATTPALMLLVERGKISLDDPVAKYIPEFAQNGKENITIKHLLTHTSGLRSGISVDKTWQGQAAAIQRACESKPQSAPGTMFVYSDVNFFTLGEVVQRVTHQKLEDFVAKEIYVPLRMLDTGYLPPKEKLSRIAPTEYREDHQIARGIVHDPTARRMGGVAGHAGLFTTASDLARYVRCLLNGGELEGVRLFKPETVKLFTSVQTPPKVARRGLGFDIDSPYAGPRGELFPIGSYGHTGWTGGSVWIDPFSKSFVIFLSNRVHPDGKGNVVPLRHKLGTLAAQAIIDFDFTNTPAGALAPMPKDHEPKIVLNGIDVLVREHFIRLRGLKVGLITNHTGRDRDRNQTIDLLKNAEGVELKCLFSPEHGIRGAVDQHVGNSVDEKTGLPIYSLYGGKPAKNAPNATDADKEMAYIHANSPSEEQIKDLDALIYDIQDVGARFYTYSATLGGAIESAGKYKKKIFVLDRVNPITGKFEGPVQTRHFSFVGFHTIPVRHGMTFGELAKMFNAERNFGADLTVVQIENWTHDTWFDETGLPWTNPSPNMRSMNAATLYTGICLLESCKISMGRGTDTPFEVFGAPYIDDVRFAWEMNQVKLPGVSFVPIRFTPATGAKFGGKECGGVHVLVLDRNQCNSVDIGIVGAQILQRLYPKDFDIDSMKRLLGHEATLAALKTGKSLEEIKSIWQPDLEKFAKRREQFLIYK